jgi:chemotaxis response regulator CheB
MPAMMRDIVRAALVSQPDLLLIASGNDEAPLTRRVKDTQADVVIVGVEVPGDLHAYDGVLYQIPDTCIVGVTRDGRDAAVVRLTPQHEIVREVSASGLLDAVRRGAAAPRERAIARRTG